MPGLDPEKNAVVKLGATMIERLVSHERLGIVSEGYRLTIENAFPVGAGLAALSMLGALTVEWKNPKKGGEKSSDKKTDSAEES